MIPQRSQTLGVAMTDSFQLHEPQAGRWGVALLVALAGHALAGLYGLALPQHTSLERPPVEVELAFREPAPLPDPLPEPPAPEPKLADVRPIARPKAPDAPAPPAAAKAGAVLTAAPAAQEPDAQSEPFDFTSDPNSTVYGAGVVAVGGTAAVGARGAQAAGRAPTPVRAPPPGDGLTAASDLSERPRLRNADPCRGYFPKSALSDIATATVRVVIGKLGSVQSASIVREIPRNQGFGSAARTCMLEQVFAPARGRDGRPAATALNVNVTFSR